MTDDLLIDKMGIERAAKENFGLVLNVDKIIANNIDVSKSARAYLFLTEKKQLYCYIHGHNRLSLGDIKKIASRIGLKIEIYLPPKGRIDYFNEIGRSKFHEVFPSRHDIKDEDIVFYKTLAPYCPALMLVEEIKDGVVNCADSDSKTGWRPVIKFAYRRIRTS